MQSSSKEANLILAVQALEKDSKLSIRAAARIYKVSQTTLQRQRASKPLQRDISANLRKLTDSEEGMLLKCILDLNSQEFQPQLYNIQTIADCLLALYDALSISPQ